MKTRRLIACGMIAALLFAVQNEVYADKQRARQTDSTIYVNDLYGYIAGYNIDDNNYFRLRDLARQLSNTSARFDVFWDESRNCIELVTGSNYSGEAEYAVSYAEANAVSTTSDLIIDGKSADVTAYNIDGYNYFKLRDLSEYIPFEVLWVSDKNSVCIYTVEDNTILAEGNGDLRHGINMRQNTARWSSITDSYIYSDNNGTFTVVDVSGKTINVDIYDQNNFLLKNNKTIPLELDIFGGFFVGEVYNYFVFGQENQEENDRKEVIRVVKYDKNFNRIDFASVSDCYTIIPFEASSLRMAESGNELAIHTGRKRYKTEDGLNHQSQLTILLNTKSMTVKNDLGRFQDNHVSHSFNQFVKYDKGSLVLVDHGDAYPRSIVMNKYEGSYFTEVDLFKIPGTIGANCTGVTVGGFEVADKHYLTAINTIDHSKVTSYDSYNMTGLNKDERNIVLLINEKHNIDKVKQVRLTDYIGNNKLASTPYLVDLINGKYMVLWEEFEYTSENGMVDNGVKYVTVDEDGIQDTRVISKPGTQLSADCQPIVINNEVVWYINTIAGRMFYRITI